MKIKKSQLVLLSLIIFLVLSLSIPKILDASTVETSTDSSAALIFNPQIKGFLPRYVFDENSTKPIAEMIKILFEYGIKIIALIALIVTIIGGLLWSIAGGSSQKVGEAKQWIFSGLSGLLLILFSYLLLNTINPALVNLKTSTIKTIGKLNLVYENKSDPNQFHEDNAQRTMTIASSTDPDGKIGCCIIHTAPTINHGTMLTNNSLVNTLSCASYQATFLRGATANSVENLCSQFYNHTTNSNVNVQFTTNPDEARQIGRNSAIVFPGKCEDASAFQEICMGKDHSNYCETKGTGASCITTDNFWGYCDTNNNCLKCKGYGENADYGYQCPSVLGVKDPNSGKYVAMKNLSSSPNVQGHKCGKNIGCITSAKKCKCHGFFCYDECIANNGNEDHWWITINLTDRSTCTKFDPKNSLAINIPNCYY